MRRLALSLVLVGCFDPSNEGGTLDQYDDDDLPSGVCRDTGTDTDPCDTDGTTVGDTDGGPASTSSSGGSVEDQCEMSSECMGGYCAAEFDPDTLQRTPKACQFMCVPNYDDVLWCSDNASCCDPDARCTMRGYCVP